MPSLINAVTKESYTVASTNIPHIGGFLTDIRKPCGIEPPDQRFSTATIICFFSGKIIGEAQKHDSYGWRCTFH